MNRIPDRKYPGAMLTRRSWLCLSSAVLCVSIAGAQQQTTLRNREAADPGPRTGPAGAGGPLAGLTAAELDAFQRFARTFAEAEDVDGGLGPQFNLDSCAGCHIQPAVGGSSPRVNPQVAMATFLGATNRVPAFITVDGPVREARFVRNADGTPDGGVHALFSIKGRADAHGCASPQTDFSNPRNLAFRIPTPVFGAGLIEAIPGAAIRKNLAADQALKRRLGITGHVNTNGNDGTVTRFGWKAQNISLAVFSGEAYNVEQGVTNELFPQERDSTPGCQLNATPEDNTNFETLEFGDIMQFAIFMRFLAAPKPAPATSSTRNGQAVFGRIGCAACHTPTLMTGTNAHTAISNVAVNLYSDLAVHAMGQGLADNISQGAAGGDEFRTAPLWGVGQRIFLLHDGRTKDLREAIRAHASRGSEANEVIENFLGLSSGDEQDLLNFLRGL